MSLQIQYAFANEWAQARFVTLVPVSTNAAANILFGRLMDAHVRVLESRGFDPF